MNFKVTKNIQLVALFFILVSIPVASVINQQVHNYQSAAHDREERERNSAKTRSIFGFVYEDINRNQIKDSGENGVAGVTVILKTRSKYQTRDDDDDRNERDRKLKQSSQKWTEKELTTDTLGSFKLDLPRNISLKSLKYRITIKPPAGYVLMSTDTRYQKNNQKGKGERIILLGIARDVNIPQPTSPPVSITGVEFPTPISEETPTMSPPVISSPPDLSPQPTSAPSTSPTLTVCPPPPICEGELVTVDQPNAVHCPIYICYSIDPGQ